MKITSNFVPRPRIYGYDLTEKERAEFDYIDAKDFNSHDFFRYKGRLYDLGEFIRVNEGSAFSPIWDGYSTDSYFSGTLVMNIDADYIIVGRYVC